MTSTVLPPYSGEDPKCIKCGHEGAATEYRAYGQCIHPTSEQRGLEPNERLHRTCSNCDYAWDEAVIEPSVIPRSKWADPIEVTE